jgi:hypothetical protein
MGDVAQYQLGWDRASALQQPAKRTHSRNPRSLLALPSERSGDLRQHLMPAFAGAAKRALIEGEAAGAKIAGKSLAFGLGRGLAGLILRPAIETGVAEDLGRPLLVARR